MKRLAGSAAATTRLKRIPYILSYLVKNGYMRGHCTVCESETIFYLRERWIRTGLRCIRCESRPRQRALFHILDAKFPKWRTVRIHECSPMDVVLERFRRDCPGYVPTHFLPKIELGTVRDGFRNETLEAQTFDDGSFDIVITQDVMEHVFDPRAAFSEIARTLVPGGVHVFTVPWHYWKETVVRARRRPDGAVEHLLPPQYHGNPFDDGGSLVVTDWGRELPDVIRECSGLVTEIFRPDDAKLGTTGPFMEIFVSRKLAG
jgi:hypothetical protein